jgi:hypothetical protein
LIYETLIANIIFSSEKSLTPKIRNKTRIPDFILPLQVVLITLRRVIRGGKKTKDIHIGKEGRKK